MVFKNWTKCYRHGGFKTTFLVLFLAVFLMCTLFWWVQVVYKLRQKTVLQAVSPVLHKGSSSFVCLNMLFQTVDTTHILVNTYETTPNLQKVRGIPAVKLCVARGNRLWICREKVSLLISRSSETPEQTSFPQHMVLLCV